MSEQIKYVLTARPLTNPTSVRLPEHLEKDLNAEQLAVVNFGEGPLLVIAGAGSGKTRTLIYRVARLISAGFQPGEILVLTFTRKAAQEMLKRASQLSDQRCQSIAGGTFHGFANNLLRRYFERLGFQENFTVLDRTDAEDLIGQIRKELNFNHAEKRFPKKNTIADLISKSVNTLKSIDILLTKDYPHFWEFSAELCQIKTLYAERKRRINVMDYDDLLIYLRHLLRTDEEIRTQLQTTFKYLLVDEYQDTNALQAEIVYLLANTQQNVMVVGDDAQSIYSFRGANFRNIMDFPTHFPRATVLTLTENYRSQQSILDLTNALILGAPEKYSKSLHTQKTGKIKPIYLETDSENLQSRFVCQKILELRESGVELREIAVLIRSGWHANDLEIELALHNIPFVKCGGFKFVESAHVKDVLSILKIICNPLDEVSWLRVLQLLEGLGPKGAQTIIQELRQHQDPSKIKLGTIGKPKPFSLDLQDLLNLVFTATRSELLPSAVLTQALKYYDPFFKAKYDDYPKRKLDLESLQAVAERYDNLKTFLSEMALEPPDLMQDDSQPTTTDKEKITVSTIHSAKGLEWHTVFLISAVDGYLPSFQALNDQAETEEERRLLYVALTRAKENLFIIKPHLQSSRMAFAYRHTGMQFSTPSRFLLENDVLSFTQKWALVEDTPQYNL